MPWLLLSMLRLTIGRKRKVLDTQRLAQVRLILSRLNSIWSPTRQPLCWQVDVYLRDMPLSDVGLLLQCVTAYGCLSRHAGEVQEDYGALPDEWLRMFNNIGSELMFDLPNSLRLFEQREFALHYSRAFVEGFRCAAPTPSSPHSP